MTTRMDTPLIATSGFSPSKKLKRQFKKTEYLIPCGVQTLSKMPSKFVEGCYPIYIEGGRGCYLFDDELNSFIDFPCALGAITLGYNYPSVQEAIKAQLNAGALYTLPSILETILAEELIKIIPSFDMVRFLKTGSEATSAAIKLARAFTNREHVAFCGYHGWHDWYTVSTSKNQGIPKCYGDLIHPFKYNDIDSLKKVLKKYKIACVILEPYIYDKPVDNFLNKVISISRQHGALVIFDEVVTGFRTPKFSAQKYYNVTPDLSCFGKGLGNGMPIACVGGRRDIMKLLEGDCFVSSTFGGELLSIAASLEVLHVMKTEKVFDHMQFAGSYLQQGYNEIAKDLKLDTTCIGHPWRTKFMFPTSEHNGLFWQECIKDGVLFGYAQFINYSHKKKEMDYTLEVIKDALQVVKDNWDNPMKAMTGEPPKEVFRLVATEKNR